MRLFFNHMKLLLVVFFSFLGLQLFSQQSNDDFLVTGIVYDAETHSALQFVSLTLQNFNTGEIIENITTKSGEFAMIVPKGKYYFIAESLSFKPFIIPLLKIDQGIELGVIELTQNFETLNEIEVVAKIKLVDYKFDKKVYYASKDIANMGGNAITVLENTPTVRIDEQGRISVRGSAVQVLVDGKPYGGQQSSADVLSLIPANSISKVEIITHSAKYDAQGGDVLNIILKKRKNDGYNGTTELHGGVPGNNGISTFLNLKNEKINVFSTASFNNGVRKKDTEINQIFLDESQIPLGSFEQQRKDNQQQNSLLLNIGSEFYIDAKNTLTTSLLFSDSNMNYDADLLLEDYDPAKQLIKASDRRVADNIDGDNLEAYIDYTTKFEKEDHQLSTLLKYDKNTANSNTFIHETETFPNSDDYKQKSIQIQDLNSYYFQMDYKLPLEKNAIFEAGQKSTFRTFNNDYSINDYNTNTNFYYPVDLYNSSVSYDENIYAFYINYSKQFEKLSLSLGLRTEFSKTTVGENFQNTEFNNNYTNYFPSVILGYSFDNNSSVTAQYRPYIDRPSIAQLNPYNSLTDERYQQVGNPFLVPSYSNYFLVEYQRDFEKIYLNTALYYISSEDIILNVLEKTENQTADGFDIYQQKPLNNGTMNYLGFELDVTYSPSKKLRLNTFIGPYYNQLSNSLGNLYDYDNFILYTTFTALYKINDSFRFQANYFYQTAKKTALNELDNIQSLNLTMSKDLFKGQSTLTFKINDVFHTREAVYKSQEANTLSNRNVIFDTQYLLSFTHRFNKASKRNANNRTKDTNINVFEIEEKMQ